MGRSSRWATLVLLGACGCLDLPDITPGQCGNGFVETGEDCDTPLNAAGKSCIDKPETCVCRQRGEVDACRWRCATAQDCVTLAGGKDQSWGCGIDNVCRRPMTCGGKPCPAFNSAASVPESANALLVADFDGSGQKSVLSVAPPLVSVHSFDDRGLLVGTNAVVAPSASPAIGDLTSDDPKKASNAGLDFTLDVSHGLSVIHNVRGGPFEPIVYASVSAPVSGPLWPFTFTNLSPQSPLYLLFPSDASSTEIKVLGSNPMLLVPDLGTLAHLEKAGTLAGSVVVRDLWPFGGPPCQQFAVALAGAQDVTVYSPCRVAIINNTPVTILNDDSQPQAQPPRKIGLPGGGMVCKDTGCQGLFAVDVNRDGLLDLVIIGETYLVNLMPPTQSYKSRRMYIAYNHGDGAYGSSPDIKGIADNMAAELSITLDPNLTDKRAKDNLSGVPLAIGDVNHDCALDYVTNYGIYFSLMGASVDCLKPSGYNTLAPLEEDHDWTTAAIADMTGDGLPDVITGSANRSGITFYKSTGTPLLNPFALVTAGGVKDFVIGDFDGDSLADLAFAQIGDSSTSAPDTLAVVFGSASGGPTQPAALGAISSVLQLEPSNVLGIAPDLISDLFVVSASTDPMKPRDITLFPGSSDRQMTAPFYLLKGTSPDFPQQSTIGQFDGDLHNDIAVFARGPCHDLQCPPDADLWLLPSSGKAKIAPLTPTSSPTLLNQKNIDQIDRKDGVLLASVNLGPTQGQPVNMNGQSVDTDEVVIIAGGGGGGGPMQMGPVSGLSLYVGSVSSGVFDFRQKIGLDKLAGARLADLRLLIADVNGDGAPDVVVSSMNEIVVLWNKGDKGDGTLDADHAVFLEGKALGDLGCATAASVEGYASGIRGVGALNVDSDAAKELVVVTGEAGYLVDYAGGKLVAACADNIPGGNAVAGGDINGDGVDDIVVAQATSVSLRLGTPASAGPDVEADAGADAAAEAQ